MSNFDSQEFQLDLQNYSGSLDLLLDLAKSQKVNLEEISITKLADQFNEYITNTENLNLEIASEYLLMATWLTYLKSKLLLPLDEEEEFKAHEIAERLKLQLKKLELIRLLSDQMLKRKRLGRDVFMRGTNTRHKTTHISQYTLKLFDVLKTYSSIISMKDFQKINIPKLPVFTMEEGIKKIQESKKDLYEWKNLKDLIPPIFKSSKKMQKTGNAGIFAGSLELVKEGDVQIKQKDIFGDIYIRNNE
jgi:segregation and condensation protein A|tara:strand:- start:1169 stop:1909 length:741 start_codon:yes stop_codon:yes gene_type:complete